MAWGSGASKLDSEGAFCLLQGLEAPGHMLNAVIKAAAPVVAFFGTDLGVPAVHPVFGRHRTLLLGCPTESAQHVPGEPAPNSECGTRPEDPCVSGPLRLMVRAPLRRTGQSIVTCLQAKRPAQGTPHYQGPLSPDTTSLHRSLLDYLLFQ